MLAINLSNKITVTEKISMEGKQNQISKKLQMLEAGFSTKLEKSKTKLNKVTSMQDQKQEQIQIMKANKNKSKKVSKDSVNYQNQSFDNFDTEKLIEDAQKWDNTKYMAESLKKKDNKSTSNKYHSKKNTKLSQQVMLSQLYQKNTELPTPRKPLTPFMLFHIQKTSQLKSKKLITLAKFKSNNRPINHEQYKLSLQNSLSIHEQWNGMTWLEKDKYYLQYENRLRKYNALTQQRQLLTGQKKVLNAYNRYYRKMYGILEVQNKYSLIQITKIIKQKWANLSNQEKQEYEHQYIQEKQQLQQINKNKEEIIKKYKEKMLQYQKQQQLYKIQILQKYNLAPTQLNQIIELQNNQRFLRNYEKKLQRQRSNQRIEQAKKQLMQQNLKKLLQLKQKQIQAIKKQKQAYLNSFNPKTPAKVLQKVSQFTTNSSKSSQQKMEIQMSDQKYNESDEQHNYNLSKTKKIKKQQNQSKKQKPPGASTFRKLKIQMERM